MNKEARVRPAFKPTKEEKDCVRWLVDFLNADIADMPYGDTLKLGFEFLMFCQGTLDIRAQTEEMEWLWEGQSESIPLEVLKEYQEDGRDLLNKLLVLVSANIEEIDEVRSGLIRTDRKREAENVSVPYYRATLDIELVSVPVLTSFYSHKIARVSLNKGSNPEEEGYMRSAQGFRNSFFAGLRSINLFDMRRCERQDCPKFFYRATAKEKHFCSNKCIWVVKSRERRAKDPKKENERRHQQYKKKVKKTHPKAKVERRKRGRK